MTQQIRWNTSVTDVQGDDFYIRGYHFLKLAENMDFVSVVYLLFKGELPTPEQTKVLNGMMVACVDHGIVISSAVARMVVSGGSPIQAGIAAGLLTCGDIAGGAGEAAAKMYQDVLKKGTSEGKSIEEMAVTYVAELLAAKKNLHLYGYGHPLHPKGDPRARWLLGLADKCAVSGDYVALAKAMEEAIRKLSGDHTPINVDAASAAVLSDLGLDWRFARPILIIARAAGLGAHAVEQVVREDMPRTVTRPEDVSYDGPPPRDIPKL